MNILFIGFMDYLTFTKNESINVYTGQYEDDNFNPNYYNNFDNFSEYGLESIKSYCLNKCKIDNFEIVLDPSENLNINFIPDIIGVSLKFEKNLIYENLKNYISFLRKKFNKTFIIAGGPVACLNKEKFINLFDAICLGEGEIPFSELLNSNNKQKYLEETPYWFIRGKEKTELFVLKDLDILYPLAKEITDKYKDKYLALSFTRGCVNACIFCFSYPFRKCVISPSLNKVISDLQFYIDNGIRKFLSMDDLPFYNKELWMGILNFLLENNCKIDLMNIQFNNLDEELLALLSKVIEDRRIVIAMDGLTEQTMNRIGKKGTYDQIRNIIRIIHKYNMSAETFVVIGYPWDTIEEIKNIKNVVKNLGFDYSIFIKLFLIKNSPIYKMAVQDGLISKEEQELLFVEKSVYLERLMKDYPNFDLESLINYSM